MEILARYSETVDELGYALLSARYAALKEQWLGESKE